ALPIWRLADRLWQRRPSFGRKGASMATQTETQRLPVLTSANSALSRTYQEGIGARLLRAAPIPFWFFVIDFISGHPFYTPNVLGTALFRRGAGLDQPQMLPISFEMVLVYTWVHGMLFCAIGGLWFKLLALDRRQ